MRFAKGVTLIEVITVVAILMVLAGLGFAVAAPARESAKQATCMSQLRQVGVSMAMYAADHPESVFGDSVTFVHGVQTALNPYGMTKELYYCPDTPVDAKRVFGSSYYWNTMLWPSNGDPQWEDRRKKKIEDMMEQGSSYVVVECDVHDQVFYQAREAAVDPKLIGAFRIQLYAAGSVHRNRVDTVRSQRFLGGT